MKQASERIPTERIRANVARIQSEIAAAASRGGRTPDAIRLIAVTKYVGLDEMRDLYQLGLRDFGEARVQDAERKTAALAAEFAGASWHLIGHLQTNKADKAIKLFHTIHSVDSNRVADALNKERTKKALSPLPCLLEVNVAAEENKFGLAPDLNAIAELLKHCSTLASLRITGLMCMAPYADNPEPTSRPVFKRLRELFDELNARAVYPHKLTELSMGMTQDFAIAIEEGATLIRLGSALFE